MKVLVTGANGLLGSYIVRELLQRNYPVRVLVRPESNLSVLDGLPVEFAGGQITLPHDVEKAVKGCTHVIHSAAMAAHKPTKLQAFRKINIDSTRYITEACKAAGIKRMVYVSTANCFINGSMASPGTEKGYFPVWLKRSGYAYSKYLAQQQVLEEARNGRLDAVVVNPTFIIGKDTKPDGGKIFSYIMNKKVAFYPLGGKNFVDASAAAAGTVNALERGKSGECYLLAGENITYKEFYRMVVKYTGQNPLMLPVPCVFLKLAGMAGDFLEGVLKKPVLLTYVNARMLCRDNYYTPDKAVKDLNLPLVSARESITQTMKWFIENNKKFT